MAYDEIDLLSSTGELHPHTLTPAYAVANPFTITINSNRSNTIT